jgi:hypothetical protein
MENALEVEIDKTSFQACGRLAKHYLADDALRIPAFGVVKCRTDRSPANSRRLTR